MGEVSQGHIRGAHVRVLETEEKCLHLSSIYCVPSVCVTRVPLQRPGGVGILIVDLLGPFGPERCSGSPHPARVQPPGMMRRGLPAELCPALAS